MARKVKIEKRVPKFDFAECKVEGMGAEIGKAWLGALFACAMPLFALYLFNQHEFIFYFGGYVVFGWFVYFLLLPRIARARLVKQGLQIKVLGNNFPEIKRLITKNCRALGLKEPECYVVNEPIPHITLVGSRAPYFLVLTQMLRGLLTEEEFAAIVQRALLHARLKQARTIVLVSFMNQTPMTLRWTLFFPLSLYAFILSLDWATDAEMSVDRAWVVLNRNPRLCAGAMLKVAAAADPNISATPAEIEALFREKSLFDQSVVEMGSSFKLKNLIHENPFIRDRFQELIEFASSDKAVALAKRMDEAFAAAGVSLS